MVELKDIYSAKYRISGIIRRTPFEYSSILSEITAGSIWLKYENRQLTGSFKIRGASNKLLLLDPNVTKYGVIAASSGNHAQGVAYSARKLGIKATIVVPENTPSIKRDAIRSLGAELIVFGQEYMEAERLAQRISTESNRPFLSPYNDPDLIAGHGTVGLEMIEDQPELDTILVPVSGGGLISGIATIMKAASEADVIGVQTIASPVMYESIRAGRIIDIPMEDTIAEGLHGGIEQGSITFDLCKRLVDDWSVVREQSIVDAMKLMITRHHEVLEGSGAVGIAAVLEDPAKFKDRVVGIVLSGGNLDEVILKKLLNQ